MDDKPKAALSVRDQAYKSFDAAADNCDALAKEAANKTEAKWWRLAAIAWRSAGACKSQDGRRDHIEAANRYERHAVAAMPNND